MNKTQIISNLIEGGIVGKAGLDGNYEKGSNSPNNLKRIFILSAGVVLEYHLAVGNKRWKVSTFNNITDMDDKNPIRALIQPRVCSSVEEIVISNKYIENFSLGKDLLDNNSVQLMNRFPRLRGIYIVNDDSLNFDEFVKVIVPSCQELDRAYDEIESLVDTVFKQGVQKHKTSNDKWFDKSYFRKYKYDFDNKLEKYFDKLYADLKVIKDKEKVREIDSELNKKDVIEYFIQNKETCRKFNKIIKELGDKAAGVVRDFSKKLIENQLPYEGLMPRVFKEMDEDFKGWNIHWTDTLRIKDTVVPNVHTANVVVTTMSKFVDIVSKGKLSSNDDESLITEYIQVVDIALKECFDKRIRVESLEKFLRAIKTENETEKPEYWIDLKFILPKLQELKLKGLIVLSKDGKTIQEYIERYVSVLQLNSLKRIDSVVDNLSKYIENLKKFTEFLTNYDNWDININVMSDFYFLLKKEGYTLLNKECTELFFRALSKPLNKPTDGDVFDVPKEYRPVLLNNIENGIYFYYNDNFENTEGFFDSISLKILYKESNNNIDFYFLLPVAGSTYVDLKGSKLSTFDNDMSNAFSHLSKKTNIRFESIHGKSVTPKTPKNSLRITTLKESFLEKSFLVSDCLNKTGVFTDPLLINTKYGDLYNPLVGMTPQGPVYADFKNSSNRSMMIGGGTGSGKTVTGWSMLTQLIANRSPIITVDGKDEASVFTNELGFIGFGRECEHVLLQKDKKGEWKESSIVIPAYIGLRFMEAYYTFYKHLFKQYGISLGTEDVVKDIESYFELAKKHGGLQHVDVNYYGFFIDEIEGTMNSIDKRLANDFLKLVMSIGSMARTAGAIRFYSTQTPKTTELKSVLSNINYFMLGKGLGSNIIKSSLQLEYDETVYSQVGSMETDTGIKTIDRSIDVRGMFGFHKSKVVSPILVKSIYLPESDNPKNLKEFLLKYYPSQYEQAVNSLNNNIEIMIKSGFLDERDYIDVKDYLVKTRYGGVTPSSEAYNLNEIGDMYEDELAGGSDDLYEENLDYGDSEGEYDESYNNNVNNVFGELDDSPFDSGFSDDITMETDTGYGGVAGSTSSAGIEQILSTNYKEPLNVKCDVTQISATLNIGGKLKTIFSGEGYYKQVFDNISEIVMNKIRELFGTLGKVYKLEVADGVMIVNNTPIVFDFGDLEGVTNERILRELQSNRLGELFDMKYLNRFTNLSILLVSEYDYIYKLKSDLSVTTWSQLFSKLPSLTKIVICYKHIINRPNIGIKNNEEALRALKDRNDTSTNIARTAAKKLNTVPSKFEPVKNFYSNKNIPVKTKALVTTGAVGATALIGAYAGVVVLPLLILGSVVKNFMKKGA